jgi:hypothetical protein
VSVTFVAGTELVHGESFGAPLTAALPTGLANGDTVLAFVFTRDVLTVPSGWTLVSESASHTQASGLNPQTIAVYTKDTVLATDSGTDVDWEQADWDLRLGVAYGAFRGVDTISASSSVSSNVTTWTRTPPTVTATGNGQMLVAIGSTIYATLTGVSPSFPTSFTRFTGDSLDNYRIAAAYRSVNTGDANSGDLNMAPGETFPGGGASNGLGSMVLLLTASGTVAEPVWIAAASPLGAPAIQAQTLPAGRISAPSPLGSPAILGYFDLAPYVVDTPPTRFVMDLETPSGLVRVPISSWQATLQLDQAQYVGCVIPSPGDYVDDIASATRFHIYGLLSLTTGATVEFTLASAPLDSVQYAQGATNYSATISGYEDAAPDVIWPESTTRTLQGVRASYTTSSAGRRVQCSIDWSLRPGQLATLDEVDFTVGYINYSVSDGDQSMTVGEAEA